MNLLTGTMRVKYDSGQVSDEDIVKAVTQAGYGASVKAEAQQGARRAAPAGELKNVEEQIREMKTAWFHPWYSWCP